MSDPLIIHRRELVRFGAFLGGCTVLAAASYAVPDARAVQPWVPGEELPLVRLLHSGTVREDARGDLVVEEDAGEQPVAVAKLDEREAPRTAVERLPRHPPAVATPLESPEGALDTWFSALAAAEAGVPGAIVRTLHWGDSTIAGDGITSTVRDRLQARFGDGGPGFLAVQVDPRWATRPDFARWPKGEWETLTITFGGAAQPMYGLAGTVSTATGEASSTLGGRKLDDGSRQPLTRFDLFYQRQPGGGLLHAKPRGASGAVLKTDGERVSDAFYELRAPDGATTLAVWSDGEAPVSVYGVALETDGPGVVWETLAVAGTGLGSMMAVSRSHLARQVARREPHLLVYQTGGNELTYPTLEEGEGERYQEVYQKVLGRLRAGAPEASCLVIAPLDKAERDRGKVVSHPNMARIVARQRDAAMAEGCAFWDARHAMGGEGAYARWLKADPPLAWTDLHHLSDEGLDLVGEVLSDALLLAYDDWKSGGGGSAAEAPMAEASTPDTSNSGATAE